MKKLFFIVIFCHSLFGKEVDESNIIQERKGNLALRASQQPSPLMSFGQLIVNKHTLQTQMYTEHYKIDKEKFDQMIFSVLYGITDYFSVFINIPVITNFTAHHQRSSGIGDIYTQFEYLLASKSNEKSTAQTTLVGTLLFPTGSTTKIPPTGSNAAGFFLGPTYSYMATDWYYYASGGVFLTTPNKNKTKSGNQLLYQAGAGRNVGNPWGCIFTWFFEFNGTYTQHNTQYDRTDRNSGGNIIYFGPTVWLSSERFFIEGGIAFPVVQHLHGKQHKTDYVLALDMGWTFY